MQTRESEQQAPASAQGENTSVNVPPQVGEVLALQKSAGNAATGRMLQRWSVLPDWLPTPTDPLAGVFEAAMQTNRAMADRIDVPDYYRQKLIEYSAANPTDGLMLLPALARGPKFYKGGWILDVQTGAKAMTLDTYIFVRGQLDLKTYIHELVHVTQYATVGRSGFLVSYFGLSAATVAKRFIMREPLDMMQSSPHETQAYNLADRFMAWWGNNA
jgi:hypothetical protein